jgi:mono/diheme cytochrome c family protein
MPYRAFVAFGLAAALAAPALGAEPPVDFSRDVLPILSENCLVCHGPDAAARKADLRLDVRESALRHEDPIVEPGDADDSELIRRLVTDDVDDKMPPAKSEKTLTPEQIATLTRWVDQGAPWGKHWAFETPTRPEPPPVRRPDRARNPIDHFVLARLEREGLGPAPEADKATLIRRLTLDLTGVPPTMAEVDAFLADDRADAYDRLVDRLLASPRYGEAMASDWLDAARYADTNGYQNDFARTMWPWRDWVVAAFNRNMPFDRFTIEQIAGDKLPGATLSQKVATGFNRNNRTVTEAGSIDEEYRIENAIDRVETTTAVFLGLTMGCARCHDHKFDPIPTEDYYALAGIFKSTHTLEGEIQKYVSNWIKTPLPIAPEHEQQLREYSEHLAALEQSIAQTEEIIKTESMGSDSLLGDGTIVDDAQAELVGNWKRSSLSKPHVAGGYIHDDESEKGEKSAIFRTRLLSSGKYQVWIAYQSGGNRAKNVPIAIRHAHGLSQVELNESKEPTENKLFELLGTFDFTDSADAEVAITTAGTSGYVVVDAIRFTEHSADGTDAPTAAQNDKQRESPALVEAKARLELLNTQLKELRKSAPPPAPTALAAQDAAEIGDCAVCIRGEPHLLGPVVQRGFLSKVNLPTAQPLQIPEDQSGRLELARWIADPQHPLTARVFVNRIWSHLVGVGLVASVDNFGQLGQRPSHPELLDYLAHEFVEHGWSTKWLIREIVRSHTYRLSSHSDAAREAIDPENILLWRAHRKRLSAESIRDTLLVATGDLDTSLAESPVASLGTLVTQNSANDTGFTVASDSRRTLYMPVIRNELPSLMRVFDFADPDYGTGDRAETTVPAQALWMLNGPVVRSQAEQLAADLLSASSSPAQRVEQLYVRALGRVPTDNELVLALDFLIQVPPNSAPGFELEIWTDVVHAVLASSSFRMTD